MRTLGSIAFLAALPMGLSACSVTNFDLQECSTTPDCRSAFGLGYTCGDAGLCELEEVPARCVTTEPADLLERPEDYPDVIVIGSLFDHGQDQAELAAAQLPFKQVNDEGGLRGQSFGLVSCDYAEDDSYDGLSSDEAAIANAEYLISQLGVQILVGPASSSKVEEVYKATQDSAPLIISGNATSPALTDLDGAEKSDEAPGTVWRTAPSDVYQGRIIGLDLTARGVAKVGVIYSDDSYGGSLTAVAMANYTGAAEQWAFSSPTGLTEALVDALADPGIEELLFISSDIDEIIAFLNAAAGASNLDGRTIFLADGAADQQLISGTKAEVKAIFPSIRGTRPQVPSGPVYESFATSYTATFADLQPTDSIFTAYTYDAAWLGIYGATWALNKDEEITGAGAGGGLRRVSSGEALELRPSSWARAKELLNSGEGFDVVGASGNLDFDPDTEEADSSIEVWAINPPGTDFVVCQTFDWIDGTTPKPAGPQNPLCVTEDEEPE